MKRSARLTLLPLRVPAVCRRPLRRARRRPTCRQRVRRPPCRCTRSAAGLVSRLAPAPRSGSFARRSQDACVEAWWGWGLRHPSALLLEPYAVGSAVNGGKRLFLRHSAGPRVVFYMAVLAELWRTETETGSSASDSLYSGRKLRGQPRRPGPHLPHRRGAWRAVGGDQPELALRRDGGCGRLQLAAALPPVDGRPVAAAARLSLAAADWRALAVPRRDWATRAGLSCALGCPVFLPACSTTGRPGRRRTARSGWRCAGCGRPSPGAWLGRIRRGAAWQAGTVAADGGVASARQSHGLSLVRIGMA